MRLAIDTSPLIDLLRGDGTVLPIVEAADELALPFVVPGELGLGFGQSQQGRRQRAGFEQFVLESGLRVLFPDRSTLDVYADLGRDLEAAGRRIPTNDLWIAAVCVQHDLVLLTFDGHFGAVPRLRLHPASVI